jgi:hypothetical protein
VAPKILANKREAIRLRTAMIQVEAVVKMLQPAQTNCGGIAGLPDFSDMHVPSKQNRPAFLPAQFAGESEQEGVSISRRPGCRNRRSGS